MRINVDVDGTEIQMHSHSDEARHGAIEELKAAIDSLKHGEEDNAIAHIIDAVRLFGRSEAFLDVAKDVLEFIGDDEP